MPIADCGRPRSNRLGISRDPNKKGWDMEGVADPKHAPPRHMRYHMPHLDGLGLRQMV